MSEKGIKPVNIDEHFWFYPLKDKVEFVIEWGTQTKIFKVRRSKLRFKS